MADGRKNNGAKKGENRGAGRKPKTDEIKFLEKLDNIIDSDDAVKELRNLIKEGNFQALKLYLEYRFGKPKERIELDNKNPFIVDMSKWK